MGIDPDIFDLLNIINRIEFLYTKGMSCSGSLKDHGKYSCYLNDFGIDRSGYQGYIMLRVDTFDSRFPVFQRGLEQLCGAEINFASSSDADNEYQKQLGIKNMALQVRVPDYVLYEHHPQHKTYMGDVWNTIQRFVNIFYEPSIKEKILAKAAEKTKKINKSIRELLKRKK